MVLQPVEGLFHRVAGLDAIDGDGHEIESSLALARSLASRARF